MEELGGMDGWMDGWGLATTVKFPDFVAAEREEEKS